MELIIQQFDSYLRENLPSQFSETSRLKTEENSGCLFWEPTEIHTGLYTWLRCRSTGS
jgi:hypothetical protein